MAASRQFRGNQVLMCPSVKEKHPPVPRADPRTALVNTVVHYEHYKGTSCKSQQGFYKNPKFRAL
jgi:hypothetical protein